MTFVKGRIPPNKGRSEQLQWLRDRVDFDGPECLIWPFGRRWNGYGQVGIDRKIGYPHRFMCELVHGAPPTPKHVAAHSCHNGSGGCVHPQHLSWLTPSENLLQRRQAGTLTTKRWTRYGTVSDADIIRIRELKGKLNQREIADMFGISYQHVSVIQNGKLLRQNS